MTDFFFTRRANLQPSTFGPLEATNTQHFALLLYEDFF